MSSFPSKIKGELKKQIKARAKQPCGRAKPKRFPVCKRQKIEIYDRVIKLGWGEEISSKQVGLKLKQADCQPLSTGRERQRDQARRKALTSHQP